MWFATPPIPGQMPLDFGLQTEEEANKDE